MNKTDAKTVVVAGASSRRGGFVTSLSIPDLHAFLAARLQMKAK
jgi:hypothetical protein